MIHERQTFTEGQRVLVASPDDAMLYPVGAKHRGEIGTVLDDGPREIGADLVYLVRLDSGREALFEDVNLIADL